MPHNEKLLVAVAVEVNEDKLRWINLGVLKSASPHDVYCFLENNVESGSYLKCNVWNDMYSRDYKPSPIREWQYAPIVLSDFKNWIFCTKNYIHNEKYHAYYLRKYCVKNKKYRPKISFHSLLQTAIKFKPLTHERVKKLQQY